MTPRSKGGIERIKHFTPSWFTVVMGTGVIGILVNNLPYGDPEARYIVSLGFLLLNTLLFIFFIGVSISRYIMFPKIWYMMLMHPVQSLFLSAFPMALATIISASISLSLYRNGTPALTMALWGIWWLDVALSMGSCILIPYVMITRHNHLIDQQNAAWLLPVVPPIVASSAGAVLCNALVETEPQKAIITIAVSCGMLSIGLSLAIILSTTYVLRLIIHGTPKAGLVVSVFIPLGPCGQGGYALLMLSHHFSKLISTSDIPNGELYGSIATCIATAGALVLWSIGFWFGVIAIISLVEFFYNSRIPFGVNFWGMIFPNGVYCLLTLQLGAYLDIDFFRVTGTVFSAFTAVLWFAISCKTLYLARGGAIFHAPCLDDVPLNWPAESKQENGSAAEPDAPRPPSWQTSKTKTARTLLRVTWHH
ncbi:hypothetical protein M408DRAFT_328198 [Serendipita vermifera MAFF 305830]|uniref:C4-dicarboxylate transporter/malic acid transport protein n=1 Tax=Serendipita vermifera MAFF 305830 TaxID=933852 RepID=A0A0C3BEW7_SERVB|nr:hypothetical protein M408DRAFT_328198 [Serendipita vermifera MAFF 305830]